MHLFLGTILLGHVAHEINNPNQTILSNATLLKRASEDLRQLLKSTVEDGETYLIGGLEYEEFRESFPDLVARIADCAHRIDQIVDSLAQQLDTVAQKLKQLVREISKDS